MSGSTWFEVVLLGAIATGIIGITLALVYDLRQAWLNRHPKFSRVRRPQMTVIIVVNQTADTLAVCLKSIRRLRYRHYDIVIAVDSRVAKQVKRSIRTTVSRDRIYIARKVASIEQLVRGAYKRSLHGEFILTLDARQAVTSKSLNHAVNLLGESRTVAGLLMSPTLDSATSLRAMVENMWQLSQKLIAKALSITGLYHSRSLHLGVLYQREAVVKSTTHRLAYDSGTEIAGKTHGSFSALKLGGYLAALAFVGMVFYSCMLAMRLVTAEPLLLSWSVVTLWIFITIWLDDSAKFWQKIGLMVCLPISYFAIAATILVGGVEKIFHRQLF